MRVLWFRPIIIHVRAVVSRLGSIGVRLPPDGKREPKDPPPDKPPVPPLIAALDVDHDGTISAPELADAPESLKTLDKNGDGELSPEELRPHRPPPVENEGDAGGAE